MKKNKKIIEVRRNLPLVISLWALPLCACTPLAILSIRYRAWGPFLASSIFLLFPIPSFIDYLYWKTILDPTARTIVFRWIFTKRSYFFYQIKEIKVYYSLAQLSECMRITFDDGKAITIYKNYKNYEKAQKELQRHIPIFKSIGIRG